MAVSDDKEKVYPAPVKFHKMKYRISSMRRSPRIEANADDNVQVGRTEEIVGRWPRGRRDGFVLATKRRMQMGSGPNDAGLSRKHVLAAIDESLRRLGTDYVDLYQVHVPDPEPQLRKRRDCSIR